MSDLHVCTACFTTIDLHPGSTCCSGCACQKYGRPRNGAIFDEADEDVPRRCLLWRTWDITKPLVLFVLLYPGTADGDVDDANVKRCLSYARLWNFGGLELVSLYSVQVEHAAGLFTFKDPIGLDNDRHVVEAAQRAPYVVCAWGASAGSKRVEEVLRKIQGRASEAKLHHLGLDTKNQPQHLMRAATLQQPIPWVSDCDSCPVPSKHRHCPECGSYDHAAANCDNGG